MDLMTLFAAIQMSGDAIIHGLIVLVIVGIIFFIAFWVVGKAPMPDLFRTVITWVLYALAALVLVNFLLTLIGHPIVKW